MARWKNSATVGTLLSSYIFGIVPGYGHEALCESSAEDISTIRALIEDGRIGHKMEDPALTAAAYAATATSINRGKITEVTRDGVEERFTAYYGSVEILESSWLAEPQITPLRGGCNAWSTATMLVRYSYTNSEGETRTARFEFAWTALWEKGEDGTWSRIMIASTDDGGAVE